MHELSPELQFSPNHLVCWKGGRGINEPGVREGGVWGTQKAWGLAFSVLKLKFSIFILVVLILSKLAVITASKSNLNVSACICKQKV